MTALPRLFHLQRDHDVTGVSGIGRVADGVLWPDGSVSIRWRGERPSAVHWDRLADAEHVHGHGGATRIVWADEQPPADRAAVLRWAADHLDTSERLRDLTDDHMLDINAAANELRRMADGTLADETTADKAARYGMTPEEYRAHRHLAAVRQIRAALPGLYATTGLRVEAALTEPAAEVRQDGEQP